MSKTLSIYDKLRTVDVNPYTEKKGGLTYLSWAYAVDQLLMSDPTATWEYRFNSEGQPFCKIGATAMVFCTVSAFGVARTAQLPVMDHRNRAIEQPDAFQVNTAMQRCLAKAIALHGIGLYIYAGEDLPPSDGSLLGDAEVDTIVKMAAAAGVDQQLICGSFGVEFLNQIPMNEFAGIVERLQKKAREKA